MLLAGLAIATVLSYLRGAVHAPVNADANYYLSLAREVNCGHALVSEITTGYTPFAIYYFAFVLRFVADSFTAALLATVLVHIINAVLVIVVLMRANVQPRVSVFVGVWYLATVQFCDGFAINLEPFQILFALLGYLSIMKARPRDIAAWAVGGGFMGMSIMCKQYSGIFVLAGAVVLGLRQMKESGQWPKFILGTALYSICAALPFLAYAAWSPATMFELLEAFGFFGKAVAYAGQHGSLAGRCMDAMMALDNHLWLLPGLAGYAALRLKKSVSDSALWDGALIFALAALLPLTVRTFNHYFILVAPWVFILWGAIFKAGLNSPAGPCAYRSFMAAAIMVLPIWFQWSIFPVRGILVQRILAIPALVGGFCLLEGKKTSLRMALAGIGAVCLASTLLSVAHFQMHRTRLLAQSQREQIEIRDQLWNVFPPGSDVQVYGRGDVYVLCSYFSPLSNYSFTLYKHFLSDPPDPSNPGLGSNVDKCVISPVGLTGGEAKKIRAVLENSGFEVVAELPSKHVCLVAKKSP